VHCHAASGPSVRKDTNAVSVSHDINGTDVIFSEHSQFDRDSRAVTA